jgi:alpha-tubulin suppressor-like RCC1 family protein
MPNFSGVWNLKEQIQAIAAGRWTGIVTDELYAWGNNTEGEVGDGTTENKSNPVQIGTLTNWGSVSSGDNITAAIKLNGTLWGWGLNVRGAIGDGTVIYRSSPVQIGALTNWSQVSFGVGNVHTASVKTDGTLWGWGTNSVGQIGDNTQVYRSSPVQIGALTNWSQVDAGSLHTAAVTTSGELYAWGVADGGRLGNGLESGNILSPIQIGALTNWSQVSAGNEHTASVKTDGTLWIWGSNLYARLGDGTVISRSSPVQIGALTNWSQVSAGNFHSAAVKADGTIWTWGNNGSGRLGDNTVNQPFQPRPNWRTHKLVSSLRR